MNLPRRKTANFARFVDPKAAIADANVAYCPVAVPVP